MGFGEFEGADAQGNGRQRGFRGVVATQRLAVAFTHAVQVGGHHRHAGRDLAVYRVAFDGLRAAGEHQALDSGGHGGFEQVGGGEDVIGQQFIERRAGVGDARQVHDHVDAVEHGRQAGFVAEIGVHEAVLAQVEIRRDAVGEGKAVTVFGGVEKRLADSAAGAGEQYVESFHGAVLVLVMAVEGKGFETGALAEALVIRLHRRVGRMLQRGVAPAVYREADEDVGQGELIAGDVGAGLE